MPPRASAPLTVVLLLAAAFAGCFGGDDPDPEAATERSEPISDTPVLTGRVLTADYLPIPNATVRLQNPAEETTTGPEGAYAFHDVPPGERTLTAVAPGFERLSQRVVLSLGSTAELDFRLDASGAALAYRETIPWDGFVSCMVAYGPNPEQADHVDCGEWDETDDRTRTFKIDTSARHVVVEMDWEEATHLSEHMMVLLSNPDTQAPLGQGAGAAPVKVVVPVDETTRNYDAGGALHVEVRPAPSLAGPEAGIDAGAGIQQSFSVYVTVFYHQPAPVEFTATPPRDDSR